MIPKLNQAERDAWDLINLAAGSSLPWVTSVNAVMNVTWNNQVLGLVVLKGPKGWSALAVTTDVEHARSAKAVFDHHAHEVIGERFRSAKAAMRACERYGNAWIVNQPVQDKCPCLGIGELAGKRQLTDADAQAPGARSTRAPARSARAAPRATSRRPRALRD